MAATRMPESPWRRAVSTSVAVPLAMSGGACSDKMAATRNLPGRVVTNLRAKSSSGPTGARTVCSPTWIRCGRAPGTTVTQRPYGAEIGTLQVAPASAQRIDGMVAHLLPNWITSGMIVAPREEPTEDAMAVFSLRFHDVFAYRRTLRTRQRQGGPWRCRRCVTVGPQDRGPAACKV
jgi:hypothetical protein